MVCDRLLYASRNEDITTLLYYVSEPDYHGVFYLPCHGLASSCPVSSFLGGLLEDQTGACRAYL